MRHKSTLKRGKRFRRRTHKKIAYGGMKSASKPLSASAKEWRPPKPLSASAPVWKPPKPLSASAPVWKPPKPLSASAKEWRPNGSSKPLSASAPVWSPPPTERMPEINNQVVAIDCEMVRVGPEYALAHVAIVDFDGNEIYNKYVIPKGGANSITDYLTEYSGITKNLLINKNSKALPFKTVKSEVHTILKDKIIVGHGLINDFKVLKYTPDDGSVWDTAEIDEYLQDGAMEFMDNSKGKVKRIPKKLSVLAKTIANNNIQVPGKMGHSPLEDARASMNLYRISQGYPKIVYDDMAVA